MELISRIKKHRVFFIVAIAVSLSFIAIWSHLPDHQARSEIKADNSLAPLVHAEEALTTGEYEKALNSYRVAFTRAVNEGRTATSEVIRRRIALAGKDIMEKSPDMAWEFLQSYVLLVKNFNEQAFRVESLYLDNPHVIKTRFVYVCTPGTTEWIQDIQADYTAMWKLNPLITRLKKNARVGDLSKWRKPEWPIRKYVFGTTGVLYSGGRALPTKLIVESERSLKGKCVLVTNAKYSVKRLSNDGGWEFDGLFTRPRRLIARILIFTDQIPPKQGPKIKLVHEYKSL